jgi:arsenite/tail-anchored protein-transporting ATPase
LRFVLVTGAGGVGTTTAAAATAAFAGRSAKVLLVTEPPAGAFEARFGGLLPAAELAQPPGIAELLTLLAARDEAVTGDWDAVVVDCPPPALLLSVLGLTESIERLWPVHDRVVRRSAFLDAVSALQESLSELTALLARSSVRLVVAPSVQGVEAARSALTQFALYGLAVDALLVNKVLPPASGPGWLAEAGAAQDAALADLPASAPVLRAPYLPVPPSDLVAFGASLYGAADPLAPAAPADPPSVTPAGDGYELRLPLPYADRSSVQLARTGDDLLVTVAGRRRRLALPPVLRRCVAVGASAGDGSLRVRFRPDPALWPQEGRL